MKKGLSVLLIAAALFGFYGGATNLNDVLACKDYWEEAGEKSTADMNKLEDGLNQLKDNEQAYLDGQDQLAEGEKTLADGEAQYAQGLKDYAAAPGKLAAGEKQLAEGKKSYADLKKLISGLKNAQKHGVKTTKAHDEYWHDGFTFDTYKTNGKAGLKPGRKYIVATINGMKDQVAMIEGLANLKSGTIAGLLPADGSYKSFDDGALKTVEILTPVKASLDNYNAGAEKAVQTSSLILKTYDKDGNPTADTADAIATYGPVLQKIAGGLGGPGTEGLNSTIGSMTPEEFGGATVDQVIASQTKGAVTSWSAALAAASKDATTAGGLAKILNTVLSKATVTLGGYSGTLGTVIGTLKSWDEGYNTLADGQAQLASKSEGIPYAFKNMVTNKTIKAAVNKYDKGLANELKKYTGDRLANEDMDDFDDDLVYIGKKLIPRALKVLAKVKADATKQLAAGKAQLAQGYKDYKEAPGKLADAEQQLADGRKQLADGKAKLAEYEDGEQQVRDGLATLVGTEPDLGLTSILDRVGGDDDFDNGDNHLELDEGLAAVDAGRGYQSEDGVLITKEITARAVGTAGLLGAGVLAILAAILSFLKKNKGAGVCAILAAVAGAFGAFYGTNAGTYFSEIAGSTGSNAGWVAAGILAAIAAVHAIVHFTAKKEA